MASVIMKFDSRLIGAKVVVLEHDDDDEVVETESEERGTILAIAYDTTDGYYFLVQLADGDLMQGTAYHFRITNLAGGGQDIVGRRVEEWLPRAGAGIVQVDEQIETPRGVDFLDAGHGGGHRIPVRLVRPVAIVVVGLLLLATGPDGGVVDVHDRHERDLCPAP